MQRHGGSVFIIGNKCGYGTIDVTKMAILLDNEYVDINGLKFSELPEEIKDEIDKEVEEQVDEKIGPEIAEALVQMQTLRYKESLDDE